MNSILVLVALTLASQLAGGQGRYSDSTNPAASPNSTTGRSTNTSLPNSQPSPNNASSPSSPGSSTSGSPYSKSPLPAFGGQRSGSNSSSSGSPALGGSQSPPGAIYPQQPGFPSDDATPNTQNGPSPTKMMQEMLTPPPDSQLRGEQVRLIQVISTGGNRNEQ